MTGDRTALPGGDPAVRIELGPLPFFDAPWPPVFPFAVFRFLWMLGLLAVGSGRLLLLIAPLN